MKHQTLFRSMALTAALLAAGWACAQQAVTKSGTPVSPAPKTVAAVPKQAAPQPLSASRPVYIAVCPAEWEATLRPLLQWRRQQGYSVELIHPASYKRDTIRQQLMERYQSASLLRPGQQYVLLVGDVDRIQAFIGRNTPEGLNNSVTDLYYGEYTGDYLPEAAVGRLPATDSAELALMVAKIIDYEQGRWVDQQHQLLLAAGRELNPLAVTTTNGQVHYLAGMAAEFRPELDTVCFYNPASEGEIDQLMAALDRGNALVNYTAHCTRAGWATPTVNAAGFDTLQHDLPTIYVNNCCLSNAYDGTCFGEQLLRRPNGGAAAVIGATNETLWNEDFLWAVGAQYPPTLYPQHDSSHPGAFDTLLSYPTDQPTLGTLMQAGGRAVSQSGSPYDAFYWETYCLLGDPATVPFMGRADTLGLAWLDTLYRGCTQMHLLASPGSRITALADTLLLGCAIADSNGEATLNFIHPLLTDTLLLTAIHTDARPQLVRVPVNDPAEARLAVLGYQLQEGGSANLSVQLKNISNYHACRHLASILQDSSDLDGIHFNGVEPQALTLAPGADTLLTFPLGGLTAGKLPLLCAHLTLSDSNYHTYSQLGITAETNDPRPLMTSLQLLDSNGSPVRQLQCGERYSIAYTLSAAADSVALGGEGIRWEAEQFTITSEESVKLSFTTYKDTWNQTFDYYFTCYSPIEDFEHGLGHYPWVSNSLFPWQLDSITCHSGRFSLRSGAIGHNLHSDIVMEVDVAAADSIIFWVKASSEANDFLNFYVDDRRRGWWSGDTGWRRWGIPLTVGHHKLRWSYQKNASGSERSDCAWIDDIRLPLCQWEQPYGISSGRASVGISKANATNAFAIYPNPTSGVATITIESNGHARTIALYDPLGRIADRIFIAPGCNSIQYSAAHLRYSIYSLVLYDEQMQPIALRKLIVTAQ